MAQNFSRDIKSLRSLFNWIYLILYVWLVWYSVTRYKESIPTALTCTASIVSVIFSGYVFSKTYEKKNKDLTYAENTGNTQPPKNETGASD